jgi:hypothetical protein
MVEEPGQGKGEEYYDDQQNAAYDKDSGKEAKKTGKFFSLPDRKQFQVIHDHCAGVFSYMIYIIL